MDGVAWMPMEFQVLESSSQRPFQISGRPGPILGDSQRSLENDLCSILWDSSSIDIQSGGGSQVNARWE